MVLLNQRLRKKLLKRTEQKVEGRGKRNVKTILNKLMDEGETMMWLGIWMIVTLVFIFINYLFWEGVGKDD